MADSPGIKHLSLSPEQRAKAWDELRRLVDDYAARVETLPIAPRVEPETIRKSLARFDFASEVMPETALAFIADGMTRWQLHTAHPAYYGVFNPAPSTMGIIGEALGAAYNAQLASYTSSPFAIEVENHVLRFFGAAFGWDNAEGNFTTGGSEANHTALLMALTRAFPNFASDGARALPGQPTLYVSEETHHSFLKAARLSGIGGGAVREVPVTADLTIDIGALEARIAQDRGRGELPFLVVGTAGTTNAGVVDPLAAIAKVAAREKVWFHLDAAWGGPARLLPELDALFAGAENSDSLTIDAHKWLDVPMTAGIFLTRHARMLERTFRIEQTHYMPPSSVSSTRTQPYAESMQWSRRFIGLKVFLTLAVAGADGYRETLRHQIAMAEKLRESLTGEGWELLNRTPLPVVCFRDPKMTTVDAIEKFADKVAATGKTWITTARLGNAAVPCLRAGIANYRTGPEDIERLVAILREVRAA